ncbi:MAG: 16S rRNA (guanine(527)-N(7))-methyltransferase RsmG [Desulfamplus sp.]|nr:16S rRNA (guanine(527)-N(7))-methyltransferase RsmG [Desulfamplus sp.]
MDKQFDKKWQKRVESGALTFGVKLSQEQLDILTFHAQELIRWNKKFNITSIVDPFDVALKHFIDSIAIAPLIVSSSNINPKVIDLGSGGGFPGIPLKVVNPSIELVMVDSSAKKVSFLKYLISQSGILKTNSSKINSSTINSFQTDNSQINSSRIENISISKNYSHSKGVEAIHCRAEEICKMSNYAKQFDFVVSRAFTALDRFTDMAIPFLKRDGCIIAMKGEVKEDELAPLRNRKDIKIDISEYYLPFEQHKRCVIKISVVKL